MAKLTLFSFVRMGNGEEGEGYRGGYWEAMWYVIQTVTGKEEELVSLIQKKVDRKWYDSCFVIQAEWMKRLGGGWRVQVRPLFPGYVFISTGRPEEVFLALKKIPRFTHLLGNSQEDFVPVSREEQEFLLLLTGQGGIGGEWGIRGQTEEQERKFLVKRSLVEMNEDGSIKKICGPLKAFQGQIQEIYYHKRYVVVERKLFQRRQAIVFGIYLLKDRGDENRNV